MKYQWLVCLLLVSGSIGRIAGVSDENQLLYEPIEVDGVKKWKCLGSNTYIDFDQINDDICDCPDGSDEPGTHACPMEGLTFHCSNKGHFAQDIPRFMVGDGVCDYDVCCDGSDEYVSGKCPDKCKEVHEQYLEFKKVITEDIQNASKVQNELIDRAKDVKKVIRNKLDGFVLEKQKTIDRIPLLEKQLKASLRASTDDLVFSKISSFTTSISAKITQLINFNNENTQKIQALENILSDLITNYNPNFNDAAVKSAVNNYQNYLSNKQEESFHHDIVEEIEKLNEHSKTLKITGTTPTISNMIHHYIEGLFRFFSEDDVILSSSSETLEAEIQSAKRKLTKLESDIKDYKEDLTRNYGPNDILRAVAGSWINSRNGEYEYRVGLLDSVYQDNNHLGVYKDFDSSTNSLVYTEGHRCWNGPKRSARVKLICGSESKILQVSEPEKCEYHIDLATPLGCQELTEEQIRKKFKVDMSLFSQM